MAKPERVKELFDLYVEHHVGGGRLSPDELCREEPDLLPPLLEYIDEYHHLDRALSSPGAFQVGDELSHYRILGRLGWGGMGVVYRAEDTVLGRTVALKFLSPELSRSREAKERLLREARAASALDHPNICTIHSVGEAPDGQLFLVMACYEGGTLEERIGRARVTEAEALNLALQAAEGLAQAHRLGIVHRDIKPANLLVTGEGVVKILDFGLAKVAAQADLTRSGARMGTAAYMSPEQVRGEPVDVRTDVWALGVVLCEMLTGDRAFRRESPEAALYAVVNEEPPGLAAVPTVLKDIVQKALKKNPQERYQDAGALAEELRSA